MNSTVKDAPLISDDYRAMQQELHLNPNYGVASVTYAPLVGEIIAARGYTEVLDYGAGKGRLGQTLRQQMEKPPLVHHYDPAIPGWSARPEPCTFVACIDVLEHIEPDYLPHVLDDLKRLVVKAGIFTVATGPAVKVLKDGRNAHLIQKPIAWWLPMFMERFDLYAFNRMPDGFWILVEPLPPAK
jgi:hypothetical protein